MLAGGRIKAVSGKHRPCPAANADGVVCIAVPHCRVEIDRDAAWRGLFDLQRSDNSRLEQDRHRHRAGYASSAL
jgi:hypothetical protein